MKRAILLLALVGCSKIPNDGYALDVSLTVDAALDDAAVARIKRLTLEVSGDETLHQEIAIQDQLKKRSAGFRYRPKKPNGVLTLVVTADDGMGGTIASGRLENVALKAGTTQLLAIKLKPDAGGGEVIAECNAGEASCLERVRRVCGDDGKWRAEETCRFACNDGVCGGGCVPNSIGCRGSVPITCDADGSLRDGAPCPFACLDGSCGGECVPGSTQCDSAIVQTCSDLGVWVSATSACPILCKKGACADSCDAGETQCGRGGVMQTCANGRFDDGSTCELVCVDEKCGGSCKPNDKSCDNSTPRTCNARGEWVNAPKSCPVDLTCNGGDCLCPANAQPRCSSDLRATEVCKDGVWATEEVCKPGLACNRDSGACRVCTTGDKRCNPLGSNQIQECNAAGQWAATATVCDVPGLGCVDEKAPTGEMIAHCRECKTDKRKCLDATSRAVCDDVTGRWSSAQSCGNGCNQAELGDCNPECNPTTFTSTCTSGQLKGCSAKGMLVNGATCQFGCKDGASCKECDDSNPSNFRCNPSGAAQVQKCTAGAWAAHENCGSLCLTDHCAICVPGTERCVAGTTSKTQKCNSAGTAWDDVATCANGCSGTSCCEPIDPCQGSCDRLDNGCGGTVYCDGPCFGDDSYCVKGVCKTIKTCECGGVYPRCRICPIDPTPR